MNTKRMTLLCAGWLAVAGGACATTSVTTDKDPKANFAQYKTFAIKPGQVVDNGVVDKNDPLVTDRITSALVAGFENKGMMQKASNPDVVVTYTAGAKTKTELEAAGGFGWYAPGWDDDMVWADEYREGTLVIDVVDASTKKLAWRAVATTDRESLSNAKTVSDSVDKALTKYPAPESSGSH